MASDFTEVDNSQVDPEDRNDTEFTWESTYDSEGNPDPENRDDQDFSWESEPEAPTTVILQRGAHYDVLRDLNAITFVPGSACQMSQAIAYIRYWSRGGTAGKTPVETEEQSTTGTDPQQKLEEDVSQVSSPGTTNPSPQTTQPSTRTILTVPENRATGRRQPVPTQVPVTGSQPSPKSGKIVSANPSGTVNTAGVTASPPPTDAVWMFLFNPEELQLSSGPDYNRAETWGVSDPNNSGQPLSWRSNRNRKLSFGKVLLHGYTFGKRVDTLEAGLQQLFMARDGENGADGPPVLEFVWGKRVFGPCVIQNIQVREKAWDKGILVNAEVSFELEQVPEWTINDGYVDILRPGRQPLVNDPILPQGQYNQPESNPDGNEPPASQPGGGSPKPKALTLAKVRVCESAKRFSSLYEDLEKRAIQLQNRKIIGPIAAQVLERDIIRLLDQVTDAFYKIITENNILYIEISTKYLRGSSNNLVLGVEGFDVLVKNSIKFAKEEADKASSPGSIKTPNYKDAAQYLVINTNTMKVALKAYVNSAKCKQAFAQISQSQARAKKKQEEAQKKAECDRRRLGSPCTGSGTTTTCSGIRLFCRNGTYQTGA